MKIACPGSLQLFSKHWQYVILIHFLLLLMEVTGYCFRKRKYFEEQTKLLLSYLPVPVEYSTDTYSAVRGKLETEIRIGDPEVSVLSDTVEKWQDLPRECHKGRFSLRLLLEEGNDRTFLQKAASSLFARSSIRTTLNERK